MSIYVHFDLVNEPKKDDFRTASFPISSTIVPNKMFHGVCAVLFQAGVFVHLHWNLDSLISISIDWFQSPTLHLRSKSCFFTGLFELQGPELGFFSFFYQCLLEHHPFSICSILSTQQTVLSPANRRCIWMLLFFIVLKKCFDGNCWKLFVSAVSVSC